MLIREDYLKYSDDSKKRSLIALQKPILAEINNERAFESMLVLPANDMEIIDFYNNKIKRRNEPYTDYIKIDEDGKCITVRENKNIHIIFIFNDKLLNEEKQFAHCLHSDTCLKKLHDRTSGSLYGNSIDEECSYDMEWLSLDPWREYEHKISLDLAKCLIDNFGYYSTNTLKGIINLVFRNQIR